MATATQEGRLTRILFPGREVPLKDGETVLGTATVYPLGFTHFDRFSRDIVSVGLVLLDSLRLKVGGDGKVTMDEGEIEPDKMIQAAAPLLMRNAFSLVRDCVTVKVEGDDEKEYRLDEIEIPHWCVPDIVDAWVEESFGTEGKWMPWKKLMTSLMSRFQKNGSSSISETLSRLVSQPDTTGTTSSKGSK